MGGGHGGPLSLSAEQCRSLGLREGESVRLLAETPRTLVLERLGAESSAVPWDRDLVLSGDVRAFPIADLLQLIHSASKSGYLLFQDGAHEKVVYLHRGEVVFACSNQALDRLGQVLLRSGVITTEQHRDAAAAFCPPTRFGRLLVERGVLTPREVWEGVKMQVEEIVRSLFSYSSGSVYLWEGEVRPDNVVRLSLPTRRLISEGLRRRDELLRLLAWLESGRALLVPLEEAAGLSDSERALHRALSPPAPFDTVCARAGLDPLSCVRAVNHLRLAGALRIEETEPDVLMGDGDGGEAVRDRVLGRLRLMAELVAPVVAVEGPAGLRGRLQRVVDEGATRFPVLMKGLRVREDATLDPAEVQERALRFPGDRERETALALGELVSYLEFELMNHPKIEEPEAFLEALETQRNTAGS